MKHYKFASCNLFGAMGSGTKEDPGSDYYFSCAIKVESKLDALRWGYCVLGDYMRARRQFTDWPHDGTPILDGEIDGVIKSDDEILRSPKQAICEPGYFPNWIEPWKNCDAEGTILAPVKELDETSVSVLSVCGQSICDSLRIRTLGQLRANRNQFIEHESANESAIAQVDYWLSTSENGG